MILFSGEFELKLLQEFDNEEDRIAYMKEKETTRYAGDFFTGLVKLDKVVLLALI